MNKEKEIKRIEECIAQLVYDKTALRKAYNYYHGVRDAEQFRHLEENYGIGVPTSVIFNPLMKKHIDVLVGEYLELDPDMKVTCKDSETVSKIQRDKKLKIDAALHEFCMKYLKNAIINILLGNQNTVNDPFFEKELERIKTNIENSFESDFEIAGQNIIEYIKYNRDLDVKNNLREIIIDLLVGGCCYYRTRPSGDKENMRLEVLNPLDTFVERNPHKFFLNKSRRAVIRRYLTREEVFEEFGDELPAGAIEKLNNYFYEGHRDFEEGEFVIVPTGISNDLIDSGNVQKGPTPGILAGLEVTPLYPYNDDFGWYNSSYRTITIYECQWLEYDHKEKRSVLHEGIKIGDDIYITRGEPEYYIKSKNDPKTCSLNINGMFFNDKNGQPFSLIQSTMSLQDRLDLLVYCRDNLIASAGTVGDWIDIASIPAALGVELPERLQKWIAYKKNGLALYDSSQDGANIINTTFNGFDDTIKYQSIQAIQAAIDSIEMQAASISGVSPQKLGQIQEREAASNVKVGIHQSSLIVKQYFHAMDLMQREIFYDLLNLAKFVYKDGLTGEIILGDRLVKIFTALPEHFTMTDFDIHIADSSESYMTMQTAQQLNMEFVKSGLVDAEMSIDILTSKNITQLKRRISTAVREKKAENDLIGQLQERVKQDESDAKNYQKTINDLENEIKRLQSQVQANSNQKLQLDAERVQIEAKEAADKKDYNDKLIKVKEKQLDAEIMQMWDGNPYNNQIREV